MKLLFLCTHNSCRSIIAEAIANQYQPYLKASSAGSQPKGIIHPETLAHLNAKKLPTHTLKSQDLELFEQESFDLIITLCDQAAGEACPVWFGTTTKIHWGFNDPTQIHDSTVRNQAFNLLIDELDNRLKQLKIAAEKGNTLDELITIAKQLKS